MSELTKSQSVARTLFVNHTSQLGGAELSLYDLATRTAGCEVALFDDGALHEQLKAAGVATTLVDAPALRSVRRGTSLLGGLSAIRGIWQSARGVAKLGKSFDALYANSQKAWVATALASWMCKTPAVWHLHDILSPEHFSTSNIRAVVGLANRFAAGVIANSQATRQAFIDAGGRANLVTVIPNGIDTTRYTSDEHAGEQSRGSSDALTVACVARLSPWKGQDVFLRALAEVPGVEGWVIGSALFGEDDYAQRLHALADELKISDRVRFMGFRDDVEWLLAQADIVAHTSTLAEPFGRVIVEAMLSGAAVIATRGGGPSEILTDGETGLLVEPGDAIALSEALGRLARDTGLRSRLAKQGQADAAKRFGIESVTHRIHQTIDRIAGRGRTIYQETNP